VTTDPLQGLPPGRRIYEQARALQRAKRRHLLRKVTVAAPTQPATVLRFPDKKEVTDGTDQNDQAGGVRQ
jgi:hypothetical protein